MKAMTPAMGEMPGMWRRLLIERADGSRDMTSNVRWLQAATLFADLRQPATTPAVPEARALEDLSQQHCLQLAAQEGFAGRLLFDGDCFEWRRFIDYQPPSMAADAGRLCWDCDVLVEEGRDVPYVEHWQRDPTVAGGPVCAALLNGVEQPDAILVLVGTTFMFARGRRIGTAPGATLAQCVAGAGSVQAARELVDCDISLGYTGERGCVILASTLPYRVGSDLAVRVTGSGFTTQDTGPRGEVLVRRWSVADAEGDPAAAWAGVSGRGLAGDGPA